MKLNVFWALSLLLLLSSNINAQLDELDLTSGSPNGRMWEKMDLQSRNMFLYGIENGITLAVVDLVGENEKKLLALEEKYTIKGFTTRDFANQIDIIYSDRANIRIPIVDIYVFVIKKLRGESPKELEDRLALLRSVFNNTTEK